MEPCVFCRIVAGELPAKRVHENEHALAFDDVRPAAPTHVLVVPKLHLATLAELDRADVAAGLLLAVAEVARLRGLDGGFRVIANNGRDGGQEVLHLHFHVVGGRRLGPMLARST